MLDIIIPSYNDYDGLKHSLDSIGFSDKTANFVTVTIIDDCSTTISKDDYEQMLKTYHWLNLHYYILEKNSGPAIARTIGIEKTSEPFVLMLDCGDVFYTLTAVDEILDFIETRPEMDFINTRILQEIDFVGYQNMDFSVSRRFFPEFNTCFYGKIISRRMYEHFKMPCANSYCHEDLPFLMLCLDYARKQSTYYEFPDTNFYSVIRTLRDGSLTHALTYLDTAIQGLIENTLDTIEINHLDESSKNALLGNTMLSLMAMSLTTSEDEFNHLYNLQSQKDMQQFYQLHIKPIMPQLLHDSNFLGEYYRCVRSVMDTVQLHWRNFYIIIDFYLFCQYIDEGRFDELKIF